MVKARVGSGFPADITFESPLELTKTGRNYHFSLNAEYLADAEQAVLDAQAQTSAAETAAATAAQSEANALTYRNAAQTAQANAETAETNAETAETNAEAAQTSAEAARDLAEDYRDAALSARDAAQYGQGVFPTTAAALGKGVIGNGPITGGSGGTNGTFDLAFSGGTGSGAAGRFVVSGNELSSIHITAPGSYTVAPTFDFSASAGLTGASATCVIGTNVDVGEYFLVPSPRDNEVFILYLVEAGPVATEVKRSLTDFYSDSYDLETDRLAPYFINVRDFTKSHVTPSTFNVATIVSRDSDTQFTVDTGEGSNFIANGSCVILDDDGDYHSVAIQSVSGDVVTSAETLPATCASAQTMHETTNGQHLSNYGYYGLADFIATRTQRHSYRKAHLIWHWHPPITKSIAFNDPKIYELDGVTVYINPTILGSATGGGFVSGTTNLPKELRMSSADENITSLPLNYYLSRAYLIQQGTSGQGIKFTIPVNKIPGFLEIPVSANRVLYDTTLYTAGEARVLVEGDGATLLDQNVPVGPMQRLFVDFSGVNEVQVSIMLASTTPTSIKLHGLYAWAKSLETSSSDRLFRRGDIVAFLGDSWTQYPTGSPLLRPDGSTSDGQQFLSERLRAKLLADGIKVTTLNMGKGGTTSEWGRYWVHSILSLTPRPNKCIIQFWINDYNSNSFAISGADAAYDFDPADQWTFKLQSLGGRMGSCTYDEWFKNIKEISDTLAMNGIKPIILLPCHLGAGAQTQGVQQNMLNKIAVGFRNINELGGGA
jgi:hypothetical protein